MSLSSRLKMEHVSEQDKTPLKSILKRNSNPLERLGSITDKCNRCQATAYPVDRIQLSRNLYYHTRCFTCITCNNKLNLQNFKSFKDQDEVEVYCARHLPKYPGDQSGSEYLGDVGIREALTLYRRGYPQFSSTYELGPKGGYSRKMQKFMEKRNSYYEHVCRSLSHIANSDDIPSPSASTTHDLDTLSIYSLDDASSDVVFYPFQGEPAVSESYYGVGEVSEQHRLPSEIPQSKEDVKLVHISEEDSESDENDEKEKVSETDVDNPYFKYLEEHLPPEVVSIIKGKANEITIDSGSETSSDGEGFDFEFDKIPPPLEFSDHVESSPGSTLTRKNSRKRRLEGMRESFLQENPKQDSLTKVVTTSEESQDLSVSHTDPNSLEINGLHNTDFIEETTIETSSIAPQSSKPEMEILRDDRATSISVSHTELNNNDVNNDKRPNPTCPETDSGIQETEVTQSHNESDIPPEMCVITSDQKYPSFYSSPEAPTLPSEISQQNSSVIETKTDQLNASPNAIPAYNADTVQAVRVPLAQEPASDASHEYSIPPSTIVGDKANAVSVENNMENRVDIKLMASKKPVFHTRRGLQLRQNLQNSGRLVFVDPSAPNDMLPPENHDLAVDPVDSTGSESDISEGADFDAQQSPTQFTFPASSSESSSDSSSDDEEDEYEYDATLSQRQKDSSWASLDTSDGPDAKHGGAKFTVSSIAQLENFSKNHQQKLSSRPAPRVCGLCIPKVTEKPAAIRKRRLAKPGSPQMRRKRGFLPIIFETPEVQDSPVPSSSEESETEIEKSIAQQRQDDSIDAVSTRGTPGAPHNRVAGSEYVDKKTRALSYTEQEHRSTSNTPASDRDKANNFGAIERTLPGSVEHSTEKKASIVSASGIDPASSTSRHIRLLKPVAFSGFTNPFQPPTSSVEIPRFQVKTPLASKTPETKLSTSESPVSTIDTASPITTAVSESVVQQLTSSVNVAPQQLSDVSLPVNSTFGSKYHSSSGSTGSVLLETSFFDNEEEPEESVFVESLLISQQKRPPPPTPPKRPFDSSVSSQSSTQREQINPEKSEMHSSKTSQPYKKSGATETGQEIETKVPSVKDVIANMEQKKKPPLMPKPKPGPKPKPTENATKPTEPAAAQSRESTAYKPQELGKQVMFMTSKVDQLKRPPQRGTVETSDKLPETSTQPPKDSKRSEGMVPVLQKDNGDKPLVPTTHASSKETIPKQPPMASKQQPPSAKKEAADSDSETDSSYTTSSYTTSDSESESDTNKKVPPKQTPIVPASVTKVPVAQASTTVTTAKPNLPAPKKQDIQPQLPQVNTASSSVTKPRPQPPSYIGLRNTLNPAMQAPSLTEIKSKKESLEPTDTTKSTNPKSILKLDKKDNAKSPAEGKTVTMASGTKSQMTKDGAKPIPQYPPIAKPTPQEVANLPVQMPEVKAEPTLQAFSEPIEPEDIPDASEEVQQLVSEVIEARQEPSKSEEEKEMERQVRRDEESKKEREWETMRLKSKTQRGNEITDNIIEMDRAIDHVTSHISAIDETLDKMQEFNTNMMRNLENMSDGEISDVERDTREVQTEDVSVGSPLAPPSTVGLKDKPVETPVKKPVSSFDEDSTSSDDSDDSDAPQFNAKGRNVTNIQKKKPTGVKEPGPPVIPAEQPGLRHFKGDNASADESSICEDPENLAMRQKLQRFEKKIDRISGKFTKPKPPAEVPTRLKLDHPYGYENISTEISQPFPERPPMPKPRRGSLDLLDDQNSDTLNRGEVKPGLSSARSNSMDQLLDRDSPRGAKSGYANVAAALQEGIKNRTEKKGKGGKRLDHSSSSISSSDGSGTFKQPREVIPSEARRGSDGGRKGQYRTLAEQKASKSPRATGAQGGVNPFKKSWSVDARRKKKRPGSESDMAKTREYENISKEPFARRSVGDALDDDENKWEKGQPPVAEPRASKRRYQRGGSTLRTSGRAKSAEMLLDEAGLEEDVDSDREIRGGRGFVPVPGVRSTLGPSGTGQGPNHSLSRSYDFLEDMDEEDDTDVYAGAGLGSLRPGSSAFQRSYRGGARQYMATSIASSMRSMPDVRAKGAVELAQILQQYMDSGRDDKIQALLRSVMRNDRGKLDDLLARFNDELRIMLEEKAREAGLRPEEADSVFNMAMSMSDLHNPLLPGISGMETLTAGGRFRDLGLGSGTAPRMVYARLGAVEQPPPAMRPPPKPAPTHLNKASIAQDWTEVDDNAIMITESDIFTFTELVELLTRDCQSEVQRVRAMFRWVTALDFTHLDFDPNALPDTLIGMLRGVKYGQVSNNELFQKLCVFAGIHCQFIPGYSKGAGYRPGMQLKDNRMFRNIWTVVFVAGAWRFVNCNWGARYLSTLSSDRHQTALGSHSTIGGTLGSVAEVRYLHEAQVRCRCDEFYFLTDPEQHIFEHFPDNKRWQLLRKPISLDQFMRLPILKSPFFNAGMSLKKKYAETLLTKAGSVTVKIHMPHFVGVSCTLENRTDLSVLKGLSLVRVIDDMVVITASPAQPGKFYLNVYVAEDWKAEETRELACSFQVHCSEHNYDRLVIGRYPDVGFLGRTPSAQKFGVALNERTDPYIVWNEKDVIKIPITIAPGLKISHQLKSFDRPGQHSAECDSYAILQTKGKRAFYSMRFPLDAFYYLTVYASHDDEEADQLECVHRLLIDCRKGMDRILPYPRQTSKWNGCYLIEPSIQHLELNKKYPFRVEAPHCAAVSVVVNGKTWTDLTFSKSGVWSKKVHVGDELGELSVYARFSGEDEEGTFVKLLDYALVQKMTK